MTELNDRIESLFAAAVEFVSSDERAAYLAQACSGDRALREQVDALLRAHDRSNHFLDRPVAQISVAEEKSLTERPGTVIGPYKLLEQLGEGGFGVVFMAEQQQPVRRKVALKVLKPGMDTKQIVARFEAERQALAIMDHTNIARVLDAGTTDSGRPYFVMELVRGIPITQFCDENRLTPRGRLELFVTVCQAVQHAHQKGVIHRDLKPSNMLVTLQDGTPIVKVIDFGIAKALGQGRLTDKTLFTGFAHMIGSPLYMSPEQAEMSGQDADTRTDIYSLGVLLYELLTGTTPFDKERLKEASYDEIRRILREEEPAKPSTRISALGQAATTVSASRQSEPWRLSQLFRGELDWIVMKALEKDRNRRYESASAFAADVQRYLHDEPVQACPPSALYRFRKFAARNKAALITASAIAMVVLLAVAGLAVSTTLIWQANKELRLERGRAEEKTKLARRLLYASDLKVAQQAWETGNLARARELLERQRPEEDQEDLRGFEWRYLWRLCRDGSVHTFCSHTAAISAVRFSPDGMMMASASLDGSVRLWDVTARLEIATLDVRKAGISSLAFTPDGKILATASNDGHVDLWEVASRRQVTTLRHAAPSKDVAFSPDGKMLALAGEGSPIQLWDVATMHGAGTLPGPMIRRTRVAFSPDGRILAAGGNDTHVRLWDLTTRRESAILRGHKATVTGLVFSPDGKTLASASNDSTIKLWNLATKQALQTIRGLTAPFDAVAFSPDGKNLVTGSGDNTIRLWDTATWQQVRTLRGHTAKITALAVSPDGNTLGTGSVDSTVKLWDIAAKQDSNLLPGHDAWVHSVTFSPDGKTLASAGAFDQTVKLWDLSSGRQVGSLTGHQGPVMCVKFSADGQTLASCSARTDNTVRLWDVATKRPLAKFTHTSGFEWLAISPDGTMLAAGSWDSTVLLWDIATGRERARWLGKMLAFTPDGKYLAVGCPDGTARLHNVNTGKVVAKFEHTPSQTAGSFQGLRSTTAGEGEPSAIGALAFSPDGQTLATAGGDLTIKLWDVATQRQVACLVGHTDWVYCVVFSPDSKTLASCGRDGTVKLWNLTVLAEAVTLLGHRGQVAALAFAPDGNMLATTGADGRIDLWPSSPLSDTEVVK